MTIKQERIDSMVLMPRHLTVGQAMYAQGALMDTSWDAVQCFSARYEALIRCVERSNPTLQSDNYTLRTRLAELERLLKRTLDHVHHGSKRSYDGVGGHERRVEAELLFWAIETTLQKAAL